ncbi:MAG: hypothetical protein KDE31_04165 [Caldilineaceae bacterium]|nr:hypothetical protein [Caldilineaceae bacterium]
MRNLETVQAIYAAFGRGDVEAVLAHCVAAPEWEYGGTSTNLPWLRQGPTRWCWSLY